jgi:hypothetical protein
MLKRNRSEEGKKGKRNRSWKEEKSRGKKGEWRLRPESLWL